MIPPSLRDLALKTAGASLVGAGLVAALRVATRPPPLPESISRFSTMAAKYPAIADNLVYFLELGDPGAVERACEILSEIAELDEQRQPFAMWKISRLSTRVDQLLGATVKRAMLRPDSYQAAVVCEADALGAVRNGLDAILHNHMVDYDSSNRS